MQALNGADGFSLAGFLAANRASVAALREHIYRAPDNLIPLIGNHLAAPPDDGPEALFLAMLEKAIAAAGPAPGPSTRLLQVPDLLQARRYEEAVQLMLDADPGRFWTGWERHFLLMSQTLPASGGMLDLIARMFSGPVLTVRWDRQLESAWQQAGLKGIIFTPGQLPADPGNIPARRWLLKIRGDALQPSGRILTLNDYETALGRNLHVDMKLPLPDFLRRLLSCHSLLAIGFDFCLDRNLIMLQQVIQQSSGFTPQKPRHFALVPIAATAPARHAQERLLISMGIWPFWFSPDEPAAIQAFLRYLAPEIAPAKQLGFEQSDSAPIHVLSGCDDPLLRPEWPIIDRLEETALILDFLDSDSTGDSMLLVIGEAGSGKNTVCRHALRAFLEREPAAVAVFVNSLRTNLSAGPLISPVRPKWPEAVIVYVDGLDEFQPRAQNSNEPPLNADGLYKYVEGLLMTAGSPYQPIRERPRIKILATSRGYLPLNCRRLVLNTMPPEECVLLLHRAAGTGSSAPPGRDGDSSSELLDLVSYQLGCHPGAIIQAAGFIEDFNGLPDLARYWPLYEDHALREVRPGTCEGAALIDRQEECLAELAALSSRDRMLAALLVFFPEGLATTAFHELWRDLNPGGGSPSLDGLLQGGLCLLRDQSLRLRPLVSAPLLLALEKRQLELVPERLLEPAGRFFANSLAGLEGASCDDFGFFPHISGIRRLFNLAVVLKAERPARLLEIHHALADIYPAHIPDSLDILPLAERLPGIGEEAAAGAGELHGRLLAAGGRPAEARSCYIKALQRLEGDPDHPLIPAILASLARIEAWSGHSGQAYLHCREAGERSAGKPDSPGHTRALLLEAELDLWQDKPIQARALLEKAAGAARVYEDRWASGAASLLTGSLEMRAMNLPAARRALERSREDLEEVRDCWCLARNRCQLGLIMVMQGQTAAGEALCRQGLSFLAGSGHLPGQAHALRCSGRIYGLKNQAVLCAEALQESVRLFSRIKHDAGLARAQGDLAEFLGIQGQWAEASRHMAAAEQAALCSGSQAAGNYVSRIRTAWSISRPI